MTCKEATVPSVQQLIDRGWVTTFTSSGFPSNIKLNSHWRNTILGQCIWCTRFSYLIASNYSLILSLGSNTQTSTVHCLATRWIGQTDPNDWLAGLRPCFHVFTKSVEGFETGVPQDRLFLRMTLLKALFILILTMKYHSVVLVWYTAVFCLWPEWLFSCSWLMWGFFFSVHETCGNQVFFVTKRQTCV